MMHQDLNGAIAAARKVLGGTYDGLSSNRKAVVVDMTQNLGQPKLKQFKKFIAALEKKDYEKAAYEALDSNYASRGQRGMRILSKMERCIRSDAIMKSIISIIKII